MKHNQENNSLYTLDVVSLCRKECQRATYWKPRKTQKTQTFEEIWASGWASSGLGGGFQLLLISLVFCWFLMIFHTFEHLRGHGPDGSYSIVWSWSTQGYNLRKSHNVVWRIMHSIFLQHMSKLYSAYGMYMAGSLLLREPCKNNIWQTPFYLVSPQYVYYYKMLSYIAVCGNISAQYITVQNSM